LRRVPDWLRRFEARSYALARRLPPDLVIRLDATPDVLARREPDMDRVVLTARTEAVRQLAFPGVPLAVIDATRPLEEVIRRVKREIWRRL
jgi:thymidylate kinase